MPIELTDEALLINIYKSVTFTRDLDPEKYFQISGSMQLDGNIKVAVYSDDHGSHLHVIYPPDSIDARFTWPSMELEDYKSKGKEFNSRQRKNIRTMCGNELVRDFLQQQFDKRISQ